MSRGHVASPLRCFAVLAVWLLPIRWGTAGVATDYEDPDTRRLVTLVKDAAELVRTKGAAGLDELRAPGTRWRDGEAYIFVLDLQGKMVVHPDAALQGQSQLDLVDIDGRPVIRGLLGAATSVAGKAEGWYHYQWPTPGSILPRWKSSFVRLVEAPGGQRYVVGSGVYNDRMERAFVVDIVTTAAAQIEQRGQDAFPLFRDRKGPFLVKDAYVFVIDMDGTELVNPAFPNLEGRALLDLKDAHGKPLVRAMLEVARRPGSGWVDYAWPRPGESIATRKSAYVQKVRLGPSGDRWAVVGCGVYLADAPRIRASTKTMSAAALKALVGRAAAVFEARGEQAFPEFRRKGSPWLHGETYFFAWTLDGTRVFHAADPASEGRPVSELKDVRGRPYGKVILELAATPGGQGWAHYLFPEPGKLFPTWKSTFVKRVTFPSGRPHVIGCGIYNMQMDRAFVEDVVDRAAALIERDGRTAFDALRDRTGPFVFLDTYVFVDSLDGTELVNPAQPSLEGRNLLDLKDVKGKAVARDSIAAATRSGRAWVEYFWYRPGSNTPSLKRAFVRTVRFGTETFVVGSGVYVD